MRGETEREMLERYLVWLREDVLVGYQRRHDTESIRQTKRQIDDILFRLETDPPRPRPECVWKRSLRDHPAPDSDTVIVVANVRHSKDCFRGIRERSDELPLIDDTTQTD